MARSDFSDDFRRIASKETNAQKAGGGSAPPKRLMGSKAPSSNPMRGGGINRSKSKSPLQ